jgi:hypothetical protein
MRYEIRGKECSPNFFRVHKEYLKQKKSLGKFLLYAKSENFSLI